MAKQCWSQTVLESGSWGHSVLQTPALVFVKILLFMQFVLKILSGMANSVDPDRLLLQEQSIRLCIVCICHYVIHFDVQKFRTFTAIIWLTIIQPGIHILFNRGLKHCGILPMTNLSQSVAFVILFSWIIVIRSIIILTGPSSCDLAFCRILVMPPTSKKLEGHIACGLFIRPSIRHAFWCIA